MNTLLKDLAISRRMRDTQADLVAGLTQVHNEAVNKAMQALDETDVYKTLQTEKVTLAIRNETVATDEANLTEKVIKEYDAGNIENKTNDFGKITVKNGYEIVNESKIVAWIRERKLQKTFLKETVKIPAKHKSTLWGMFHVEFEDRTDGEEPTIEALQYSENPWIKSGTSTVFKSADDLTAFLD